MKILSRLIWLTFANGVSAGTEKEWSMKWKNNTACTSFKQYF